MCGPVVRGTLVVTTGVVGGVLLLGFLVLVMVEEWELVVVLLILRGSLVLVVLPVPAVGAHNPGGYVRHIRSMSIVHCV